MYGQTHLILAKISIFSLSLDLHWSLLIGISWKLISTGSNIWSKMGSFDLRTVCSRNNFRHWTLECSECGNGASGGLILNDQFLWNVYLLWHRKKRNGLFSLFSSEIGSVFPRVRFKMKTKLSINSRRLSERNLSLARKTTKKLTWTLTGPGASVACW